MKFEITNIETGQKWITESNKEANEYSFQNDKYDVEIIEDDGGYDNYQKNQSSKKNLQN